MFNNSKIAMLEQISHTRKDLAVQCNISGQAALQKSTRLIKSMNIPYQLSFSLAVSATDIDADQDQLGVEEQLE